VCVVNPCRQTARRVGPNGLLFLGFQAGDCRSPPCLCDKTCRLPRLSLKDRSVQCSSQHNIPRQWLFAGLDARVALGVDRWGRRPRAGAPTPRAVEVAVRVPGHVTVDEYAEGIKQYVSACQIAAGGGSMLCEEGEVELRAWGGNASGSGKGMTSLLRPIHSGRITSQTTRAGRHNRRSCSGVWGCRRWSCWWGWWSGWSSRGEGRRAPRPSHRVRRGS
jgi:hypothetical protein